MGEQERMRAPFIEFAYIAGEQRLAFFVREWPVRDRRRRVALDGVTKRHIVEHAVAKLVAKISGHDLLIPSPDRIGMAVLVVVVGDITRLVVAYHAQRHDPI